jgi:hypothetical protein
MCESWAEVLDAAICQSMDQVVTPSTIAAASNPRGYGLFAGRLRASELLQACREAVVSKALSRCLVKKTCCAWHPEPNVILIGRR